MVDLVITLLIAIGLFTDRLLPHHAVEKWGPYFSNNLGISSGDFEIGVEILIAVVFVILIVVVRRLFAGFPKLVRNKFLRKFETVWLEKVGRDDRPFAIGLISFRRDRWVFEGFGYDLDFRRAAHWYTSSLYYHADRWYFAGEAFLINKDTGIHYGHGTVIPVLTLSDEESVLTGHVSDIGINGESKIFAITPQRADELFSKNTRIEDIRRLTPQQVKDTFVKARLL